MRISLVTIFLSFLRLGLTAFGGPAMVAYVRALSVEKNRWLDEETFTRGLTLCQILPGAIVVNLAAYVGLIVRGPAGMLMSFAGFTLPAFCLLIAVSHFYRTVHDLPEIVSLFQGLHVIVVAIVMHAAYSLGRALIRTPLDAAVVLISAVMLLLKCNPFLVLIGAGAAAVCIHRNESPSILAGAHASTGHFGTAALLSSLYVLSLCLLFFYDRFLFDLSLAMAKVQFFAFGGGFAALTLMFHEVVEARQWLDAKTFMDGVALGQVTPGPILITATFVGYLVREVPGAFAATLAMFLPGLILIMWTLPFIGFLRRSPYFIRATRGMLASFVGLLVYVGVRFSAEVPWDAVRLLFGCAVIVALLKRVDVLYVVVLGATVSIALFR